MTGLYRVGTKVTLPAKIRKMSKRRQKIALIRRLRKELEGFVGRKYDDDLVDFDFKFKARFAMTGRVLAAKDVT